MAHRLETLALDQLSADPSSPPDGSLWFYDTDGELRLRRAGHTAKVETASVASALTTNGRSYIGTTWTTHASVSPPVAGVYVLDISFIYFVDSTSTGGAQVRLTRDGTPIGGNGLDTDGNGLIVQAPADASRPAWGPTSWRGRLVVYSDGSDTFAIQANNTDGSSYTGIRAPLITAHYMEALDAVDAIGSRVARFHAERGFYAYDNASGPVDWMQDPMSGALALDSGSVGGGTYNPDGWTTGVDTVTVGGSGGGWIGDIVGSGNNHTFVFVIDCSVVTGTNRNLFRSTGSNIACLQSHTGDVYGYEYNHSGTMQTISGTSPVSGKQCLIFEFDKDGDDELRVWNNFVDGGSVSLTGQSGVSLGATNQGLFCYYGGSFGLACEVREFGYFNSALSTVNSGADWTAIAGYMDTTYGLDDS